MTPVRLEPAAPQSRVKHSTTEPLCSLFSRIIFSTLFYKKYIICIYGINICGPAHKTLVLITLVSRDDSNKPAHKAAYVRSLTRAFAFHIHKVRKKSGLLLDTSA